MRSAARTDAEAVVRLVDEQHLARVREARAYFEDTWRPGERDAVAKHRSAVSHLAGTASAQVVAAGTSRCCSTSCGCSRCPAPSAVIAWSAGAMALTERVLLFHDCTPYSPSDAEFLDSGAGWLRGCVLLPHARRRLQTDDPARMAELAARAAPTRCVVLDDGVRLDVGPHGELPAGGARRRRRRTNRAGDVTRSAINRLRAAKPDTDLWYAVLELPEGSRIN